MPVAVVDNVASGSPVIYYVHVDHLMRPIRMTNQAWTWVWDVVYAPFGGTPYLYTNPEVMNGRFPGQWFQLETSLAYNWHRHYDPTTGRYLQPDPLLSDDGGATVAGLPVGTITGGSDGRAVARSMGWKEAHDIIMGWPSSSRPMLQDGPSVYGYAGQNPLSKTDPRGLISGGDSVSTQSTNSCNITETGPFIRAMMPANDNRPGNWCYGTVHSVGAYGVVNCSYICTNGLKYMGYGSMFQGAPFCPDVSGGM